MVIPTDQSLRESSACAVEQSFCRLPDWEFRQALSELPTETVRYHLEQGDFERWLQMVLHDDELARRLRKLAYHKFKREETLRPRPSSQLALVLAAGWLEVSPLIILVGRYAGGYPFWAKPTFGLNP